MEKAVLLAALTWPTLIAWLYFVVFAGDGVAPNPVAQALYAGGKVVQFGGPLVWLWLFARQPLWPSRATTAGLGLGAAFGLAVSVGIGVIYAWLAPTGIFDDVTPRLRGKLHELGAASPAGFLALAAFLSFLHSGLEEWYWRGFVYRGLSRQVPQAWALGISSLGFMAHHVIILAVYFPQHFWVAAVPFSLCIACGGLVWAWLYDRTHSLYGPWLSHALVDLGIMALGYHLVFR